MEWDIVKAEDFCVGVTDGTHDSPKAVEEGRYLITSKHLGEYEIDFSTAKLISEDDYQKIIKRSNVGQWDLLFSMIGTIGNTYLEKNECVEYACKNMGIFQMGGDKERALWLYYYLKSPDAKEYVFSNLRGSTQQYLPLGGLRNFPIPVPQKRLREKIVSILKVIDDKIENNTKINRNLSEQAKAIFDEELLKFDSVPEGWEEGSLIDIADYLNGLAMQKYRPADDEVGLPVLKIKELRQGSCDSSSELCSPNVKPEYIIHDGDVIFSWSGSLLVDFWCGGKCGLNQHLFKVSSKKYDKWFYYAWTLYHLDRFIAVAADKATTMGHIKREELKKAEVLIPDSDSYKRIGDALGPIYDMIISNRVANRKLASLRDEILPKLMSGEIDISEVEL